MKNFALIGAAGYVAPRHMNAIKETQNNLVAAYDKCDSVGIIDNYFPQSAFFTEQELFDRHCTKYVGKGNKIDYVSICTPNYLHDAHIRYGLRIGADVICEKPIVLNPWNIDVLKEVEQNTGQKINTILQLRLHPSIIELRNKVMSNNNDKKYDVDLTYITSRGNWYYTGWKGDVHKSGGVATNIGIHFYDMLTWIFGEMQSSIVHISTHDRVAGFIEFEKARVRYFLSINADTLPKFILEKNQRTYRVINIDNSEFEFSKGFEDLHTLSYKEIIAGKGFGLDDARASLNIVYDIRNASPVGLKGDYHPFAKLPLAEHPFGW
ncbi:Gfo/Idh/MocA family oxidoreductase [Bacteroidales bacterium OttesenSCG-928-K03]|nr:Gfo/Idh/MocA family oxidoreductase [Odoribacter sp. OttesenSCG-928-L07]MDL2240825.1 Gfo/Idh/MocA family oxidoreductase [Bacteroidales bacterium OttesenSCG-928-K22]MDL2242393.1 Gfo/Idh/MocA family oxidoreductase [Bacteroidales bacterium OttesenSCG-928-K03]